MIDPLSKYIQGWEIMSFIFTLYISASVPFVLGFDIEISFGLSIFEYCIDAFFVMDFFI
jgi:hypothetical protein